jgi:magnesium chelatase family protein
VQCTYTENVWAQWCNPLSETEMPEFDRSVLEVLRQPLEDGEVTVARAHSTMTFPAQSILIGAMNPCPCGFRGLPEQRCVSNPDTCIKYAGRISGPLMDRIDLHIEVPRLKPDELIGATQGECSEAIRERVLRARLFTAPAVGEKSREREDDASGDPGHDST